MGAGEETFGIESKTLFIAQIEQQNVPLKGDKQANEHDVKRCELPCY